MSGLRSDCPGLGLAWPGAQMKASARSNMHEGPRDGARTTDPASGAVVAFVSHMFMRSLQAGIAVIVAVLVLSVGAGALSAVALGIAGCLLVLAVGMLRFRDRALELLARRPRAALLLPVPVLVAIALDGGGESRWTPLIAVSVVIPALLGHPRIALACAGVAASGQAIAVLIAAEQTPGKRVLELVLFNATGTVAAALGVALSTAALARSIRGAPTDVERLRGVHPLLPPALPSAKPASADDRAHPCETERLTPAELRVVELLATGRAPRQIALDLGIAIATVRTHLKRAKRKTRARTLSELAGAHVAAEGQL